MKTKFYLEKTQHMTHTHRLGLWLWCLVHFWSNGAPSYAASCTHILSILDMNDAGLETNRLTLVHFPHFQADDGVTLIDSSISETAGSVWMKRRHHSLHVLGILEHDSISQHLKQVQYVVIRESTVMKTFIIGDSCSLWPCSGADNCKASLQLLHCLVSKRNVIS